MIERIAREKENSNEKVKSIVKFEYIENSKSKNIDHSNSDNFIELMAINIFKNKKILNLILFGSMPIIIVGFILYNFELIYQLRNLKLIASTTLIFGILLYFVDKRPISNNINQNLNFKNIIAFGIFQILSLIPGVSRSGIVITA